jgi:TctA family transporter
MLLSRGDFMTFFERPISGAIMAVTGLLLAWAIISAFRSPRGAVLGDTIVGAVGPDRKK